MFYISLLVHEQPSVVANQVENFLRYLEGAQVVIHVNARSGQEFRNMVRELESDRVHVNPASRSVSWGAGILEAHLENRWYAKKLGAGDGDYFLLNASNDMYVRRGALDYCKRYIAGFQQCTVDSGSKWVYAGRVLQDDRLATILDAAGAMPLYSQHEGTFYRFDLLDAVCHILDDHYCFAEFGKGLGYPREEVLLPSVAFAIAGDCEIGFPIVYSEVTRQTAWVLEHVPVKRLCDGGTSFSMKVMNRIALRRLRTTQRTVDDLVSGSDLDAYRFSGLGGAQMYDSMFGVKRVPRSMDDELRTYISNLGDNEAGTLASRDGMR